MNAYNAKITIGGVYLPFYGWSVVSMVKDNALCFLEAEIKGSSILSKYFSALPATSYHVTICNIWSNGRPLLAHQERFLRENYSKQDQIKYNEQSRQIGFFNPDFCINSLLSRVDENSIPSEGTSMVISCVYFSGSTLGIAFTTAPPILDECRDETRNICEIEGPTIDYHLTLAYNFRDVDYGEIRDAVQVLDEKLRGTVVALQKPMVAYFSDMTQFISYKLALGNKSNRTHAPMY